MRLLGALKQPLPYFVLLGGAVFLLDSWLRAAPQTLHLTPEVQREVASRLEQQLSRPPTRAELDRGLEDWVDTEVLFREATALGLDQNDSVIHDHLAQKLRYIVFERTILPAPSEAELRAELAAHPARYQGPATFDLTHAFISRSASPGNYDARVQTALTELARGAEPKSVGDHFPRGPKFRGMTQIQFEQIFQAKLGSALQPKQVGAWQILDSPRGAHLIRLDAASDGSPSFEALRPALTANVQTQKKQAAAAAYVAGLRRKYPLDAPLPR